MNSSLPDGSAIAARARRLGGTTLRVATVALYSLPFLIAVSTLALLGIRTSNRSVSSLTRGRGLSFWCPPVVGGLMFCSILYVPLCGITPTAPWETGFRGFGWVTDPPLPLRGGPPHHVHADLLAIEWAVLFLVATLVTARPGRRDPPSKAD